MIATIILIALLALASLAAVIYGIDRLVTLMSKELRLAHESGTEQVRELVAQHSQALNDAVTKALQSVSEQLGPRVMAQAEEVQGEVAQQQPPWVNWDEYDPFPDPTDATDPDPDNFNRPTAMSVPVGFTPIPGDTSAEGL